MNPKRSLTLNSATYYLLIFPKKNISQLQVAMHYVFRMQVLQPIHDLSHHTSYCKINYMKKSLANWDSFDDTIEEVLHGYHLFLKFLS